eukprot:maker-scaffold_35-snap-gene-2.96-mRNA-1 protein AED:0.00 eAED:0.00 QI:84/1/1/1/1/1/3/129/688
MVLQRSLNSFSSSEQWQLSVQEAEELQVHDRCPDNWYLVSKHAKKTQVTSFGYVPADLFSQVTVKEKENFIQNLNLTAKKSTDSLTEYELYGKFLSYNDFQAFSCTISMNDIRELYQAVTNDFDEISCLNLPPAWADNKDKSLNEYSAERRLDSLLHYLRLINAHVFTKLHFLHWVIQHSAIDSSEALENPRSKQYLQTINILKQKNQNNFRTSLIMFKAAPEATVELRSSVSFSMPSIPVLAIIEESLEPLEETDGVLGLKKGEVVAKKIQKTAPHGWVLVERSDGATGLVPNLYVRNMSENELNSFFGSSLKVVSKKKHKHRRRKHGHGKKQRKRHTQAKQATTAVENKLQQVQRVPKPSSNVISRLVSKKEPPAASQRRPASPKMKRGSQVSQLALKWQNSVATQSNRSTTVKPEIDTGRSIKQRSTASFNTIKGKQFDLSGSLSTFSSVKTIDVKKPERDTSAAEKKQKHLTGFKKGGITMRFHDLQKLVGKTLQGATGGSMSPRVKKQQVKASEKSKAEVKNKLNAIKQQSKSKLKSFAPGDERYLKYKKMLDIGLGEGAVQNALERDGIDPASFFQSLVAEKTVKAEEKALESQFSELKTLSESDPEYKKFMELFLKGVSDDICFGIMEAEGFDGQAFKKLLQDQGKIEREKNTPQHHEDDTDLDDVSEPRSRRSTTGSSIF